MSQTLTVSIEPVFLFESLRAVMFCSVRCVMFRRAALQCAKCETLLVAAGANLCWCKSMLVQTHHVTSVTSA